MGYQTEFTGNVSIDPPLNPYEIAYLRKFNQTRRMRRHNGPYFVEGSGYKGQGDDGDITGNNKAPEGQPGLWCKWEPNEDGGALGWDGMEKFYDADEWMAYLIDHFLKSGAEVSRFLADWPASWPQPHEFAHFTFDHVVNGTIEAQGEDPDDRWALVVANNVVTKVPYPSLAERMGSDPTLAEAVAALKAAGVTVEQFAELTGQDY